MLRIRQEEELPVYEKLGDIRSWAGTMGYIAEILQSRGQLDEALRIRQEEQLPVCEKLGDIRGRALTMAWIAHIARERGEWTEALTLYQKQVLPDLERLGNQRELLQVRRNVGLIFLRRNQDGDREAAHSLLLQALAKAREMQFPEAVQIQAILERNGLVDS